MVGCHPVRQSPSCPGLRVHHETSPALWMMARPHMTSCRCSGNLPLLFLCVSIRCWVVVIIMPPMCERVCTYGAGVVGVYAGMVFITLLNVTWLLYIIWVMSWSVLSGCCFRRLAHWQALSVSCWSRVRCCSLMMCFHMVHDTSSRLSMFMAGTLNWSRKSISSV